MLDTVIVDVLALVFWGCAITSVFFMAMYIVFLRMHVRLRRRGREEEERLLALAPPPDEELPHVVVQIASYNEGFLVRRAAEAVARLEWPIDRLHIQICDDSTDDTLAIAHAVAGELRGRGFDVAVLHRKVRDGFKAGSLAAGVGATPHQYFAIFDADYVPAPDFLRRCMPVLLSDATLSFVQARIDYLNPDVNALTRAQVLLFDHHTGVEQTTRSWDGHALPFNGTCGIWRRAAIEAGGGWRGDTLAEDLDLSYRAWLAGFHGVFLATVTAPGELPTTFRAWASQQRRWTKGFSQIAYRMMAALFLGRIEGTRRRIVVFTHLSPALLAPVSALATVSGIALLILRWDWALWLFGTGLFLFYSGYGLALAGLLIAQRTLHGDRARSRHFVQACAQALGLRYYLDMIATYYLARDLIARQPVEFVRTPKQHPSTPHRIAGPEKAE
ncbi:MAG: glycosyltransferase family 2 protein [Reyranella sp.]|uniref:glycosyltransferase n=1 Tax=Reyranella sp. TaxID=1929291 RepID=UPI003D0D1119